MKATAQQYNECVDIYENSRTPVSDIFDFAVHNNIDEYSLCSACEAETPDVCDGSCLVCGSSKD